MMPRIVRLIVRIYKLPRFLQHARSPPTITPSALLYRRPSRTLLMVVVVAAKTRWVIRPVLLLWPSDGELGFRRRRGIEEGLLG